LVLQPFLYAFAFERIRPIPLTARRFPLIPIDSEIRNNIDLNLNSVVEPWMKSGKILPQIGLKKTQAYHPIDMARLSERQDGVKGCRYSPRAIAEFRLKRKDIVQQIKQRHPIKEG